MTPTEAALDHNTDLDAATTGTACHHCTPPIQATAINLSAKHHITDHPHIEALQVINPEIAVGHINDHPTNLKTGLM